LPATPCLSLPVAVSLKRFFTPLLVLSLGIFVSFVAPRAKSSRENSLGDDVKNRHGSPDWPGDSVFQ
jgi:hypothetical protein